LNPVPHSAWGVNATGSAPAMREHLGSVPVALATPPESATRPDRAAAVQSRPRSEQGQPLRVCERHDLELRYSAVRERFYCVACRREELLAFDDPDQCRLFE